MKPLLLSLSILFSIYSPAQTPREWMMLAGHEYKGFLDYYYKLTKDNTTTADVDSLQSHIQATEIYIQKILNYEHDDYAINYKKATAKYMQVSMQYYLGIVLLVNMNHEQEALAVFKRLEENRNISVFESGLYYPLSYTADGDTYTVAFDDAKDLPGKLITVLASLYDGLKDVEEAAYYHKKVLSQEYVTPWNRYLNAYSLIIYKKDKHEEDEELMNYYFISLSAFEGFTAEDFSNLEKAELDDQAKIYDEVILVLDRNPELSSSGAWHLKIGKMFYGIEDYQRAANCFKKDLAEDSTTSNYNELGDAAHTAMKINDKEMLLTIIDRIRTKSYKLESNCSLLKLLYECYTQLDMTSEAKSLEKKISRCPKLEKREEAKERNYFRKLDRY